MHAPLGLMSGDRDQMSAPLLPLHLENEIFPGPDFVFRETFPVMNLSCNKVLELQQVAGLLLQLVNPKPLHDGE